MKWIATFSKDNLIFTDVEYEMIASLGNNFCEKIIIVNKEVFIDFDGVIKFANSK